MSTLEQIVFQEGSTKMLISRERVTTKRLISLNFGKNTCLSFHIWGKAQRRWFHFKKIPSHTCRFCIKRWPQRRFFTKKQLNVDYTRMSSVTTEMLTSHKEDNSKSTRNCSEMLILLERAHAGTRQFHVNSRPQRHFYNKCLISCMVIGSLLSSISVKMEKIIIKQALKFNFQLPTF